MSVTKRISGNYTLINSDPTLGTNGNITFVTNTMYIDGNLLVGGNSTSIARTNTYVSDNILTLNQGETNAGVSAPGYSGLEIDRGTLANVQLRWNENIGHWQLTNDGVNYLQIASSTSSNGAAIGNVYQDSAPAISANLNLYSHSIFDSTVSNVSANLGVVGGGGTGVYSTTSLGTHEHISKRMALIYTTLLR